MNRLLIICDTYPPQSFVGGLRPAMFARHLPEFGWQPTVLARDWPNDDPVFDRKLDLPGVDRNLPIHRVIVGTAEENHALRKRTIGHLLRDFFCPDYSHPPGIMEQMAKYLDSVQPVGSFDVVLGTAPDLWPITLARNLARRYRCPWVADLRDIAEQDSITGNFRSYLLAKRSILRRNFLLRTASAVVVVSSRHAQFISKKYSGPVETIYNGYDSDLFESSDPLPKAKRFNVVYMGRLLNERHGNPSLLFKACDILWGRIPGFSENLSIDFYGAEPNLLSSFSQGYSCRSAINHYPYIEYLKVPEILRSSCVLLLLVNSIDKGIMTTKLFEYLPIGRPILCCTGDVGEVDRLLQFTRAGLSVGSLDELVRVIADWYQQWLRNGFVSWQGDMQMIRQFARRVQTRRVAELLDQVVKVKQ